MGMIHPGPPEELVFRLKQTYKVKCFIETGTYLARTALWASQHFENVWTIEASEHLYYDALRKRQDASNINFILGDSRLQLINLVKEIDQLCLFWLDSHYSGDQTYGVAEECPLIDELHTIMMSPIEHFIMIDDSRLFLSPPPEPHKIEQWPTIGQIIRTFEAARKEYYLVIIEDVIVAVPEFAKPLVAKYCREQNTLAWEKHVKSLTVPN
jgi:hypothetical protein